jgi:hypothetical protein
MSGWAAAAQAGADMLGAAIQSRAARKASDDQSRSAERALEEERRQFDLARADMAPWMEAGRGALGTLTSRLPELTRRFTMADLENDPIYRNSLQFGMDEGLKGVRRMFGARGIGRSGAAVKGLTRFANDYGMSKGNEAFNRFTTESGNIYNRLSGVAGTGQTAVGQVANLGANVAANAGNLMTGAANARGAATIAGANAWGNALSRAGNRFYTQSLIDGATSGGSSNPYSMDDQPNYSGGYY